MDKIFEIIKSFFNNMNDLLLAFLSVGILVQVLFGGSVFGMDVVGNVTNLINSFYLKTFIQCRTQKTRTHSKNKAPQKRTEPKKINERKLVALVKVEVNLNVKVENASPNTCCIFSVNKSLKKLTYEQAV